MERDLVVIAHNLRSCHNVGSLLRTADGIGVKCVYLSGYTPYPKTDNDGRLPHISNKITQQIKKTSLGAETTVSWKHAEDINELLNNLRHEAYEIAALEQTAVSIELPDYIPSTKVAIILGEEVAGIGSDILEQTDIQLEIPMFGSKESFNVIQAAAMALYHCRFAKLSSL